MSRNLLCSLLLILLAFQACVKEETELPALTNSNAVSDVKLIVEGGITNIPGRHLIKLSTPGSYGSPEDSVLPITGAEVTVMAGSMTITYLETEEMGTYATVEDAAAPLNTSCQLTVVADGATYTAIDFLGIVPEAEIAIPIAARLEFDAGFRELDVAFQNFGYAEAGGFILIQTDVEEQDTSISSRPFHQQLLNDFIVYTHSGASPQGLFPLNSRTTGFRGDDDDFIRAYRLHFSPAYYAYLISVFNLTDWGSGLFTTVPGDAETNLSRGARGYFYAIGAAESIRRFPDL